MSAIHCPVQYIKTGNSSDKGMEYAPLKQEAEVFAAPKGQRRIGLSPIKPDSVTAENKQNPAFRYLKSQISGGSV